TTSDVENKTPIVRSVMHPSRSTIVPRCGSPPNTEISCKGRGCRAFADLVSFISLLSRPLLQQLSKPNAGDVLQFVVGPPPWRAVALNPGGHFGPGLQAQDLDEPAGRRRHIG